jgi:hypothetical protein
VLTKQLYLGELILSRVALGRLSATGFYEHRCQLCHDHSLRAGWKIEPEQVFYNCYNCGFKAWYEEGSGKFSRWMREVLSANGIRDEDVQQITSSLFFNKAEKSEKEITLESLRKINLNTPEVSFPPRTFLIGHDEHLDFQEPLIEYLDKRRVDPLLFYFSLDPKHLRRVIIPFWRNGTLIFWQSRTIDDVKPRYLNSSVTREAVLYGYDQLYSYNDTPIFVTEGVFDAISIDGVCLLGSKLSEAKIELLKRTKRRIIFVIDRDKTGHQLGQSVLDNGWELTFVDSSAKDVNDSIQQYGKIYTMYALMKNATNKSSSSRDSRLELDLEVSLSKMRKSRWTS